MQWCIDRLTENDEWIGQCVFTSMTACIGSLVSISIQETSADHYDTAQVDDQSGRT